MGSGLRILIRRLVNSWGRQRTIALLPWLVLGIGFAGTAAVSEQTRRFGEQEHLRIEKMLPGNVGDALRSKLKTNIATLAAVVGLFNAAGAVNRQNFATFHQTIALNSGQLKGVQGLGFARWIPAHQLADYEQRIQTEGFVNFRVRPPGTRTDYTRSNFLSRSTGVTNELSALICTANQFGARPCGKPGRQALRE